MKKSNIQLKVGVLALLAGLYSTGIIAASVNGQADAEIVQPIALAITNNMDFGSVAAGTLASTINVDDGGVVTNAGGDAVVINNTGSALTFTITGANGANYVLSVGNGVLNGHGNIFLGYIRSRSCTTISAIDMNNMRSGII